MFNFLLLREIIHYDDACVPLVHTDVEKLESKPAPVYLTGQLHRAQLFKPKGEKM